MVSLSVCLGKLAASLKRLAGSEFADCRFDLSLLILIKSAVGGSSTPSLAGHKLQFIASRLLLRGERRELIGWMVSIKVALSARACLLAGDGDQGGGGDEA